MDAEGLGSGGGGGGGARRTDTTAHLSVWKQLSSCFTEKHDVMHKCIYIIVHNAWPYLSFVWHRDLRLSGWGRRTVLSLQPLCPSRAVTVIFTSIFLLRYNHKVFKGLLRVSLWWFSQADTSCGENINVPLRMSHNTCSLGAFTLANVLKSQPTVKQHDEFKKQHVSISAACKLIISEGCGWYVATQMCRAPII